MKTTITMSIEEAEERLAARMADDLPYSNNEVSVNIVSSSESQRENVPLNRASKIELIKLVRALSDDILKARVKTSTHETGIYAGKQYFGLAESKEYVEKYLAANSPKV